MRVIFYGLSDLTKNTVTRFIEGDHEVIIIDSSKEKIESASQTFDCGFLEGDASHPQVLAEANPDKSDLFFALTESSQNNLVACLVARSLGIKRTILAIHDSDYEKVCSELGMNEIIVPTNVTSSYLYDSVFNENLLEMFQILKDRICLYKFTVKEEHEGDISELNLSGRTHPICYFRKEKFHYIEGSQDIKKGDEVILLTDKENLKELTGRFENEKNG